MQPAWTSFLSSSGGDGRFRAKDILGCTVRRWSFVVGSAGAEGQGCCSLALGWWPRQASRRRSCLPHSAPSGQHQAPWGAEDPQKVPSLLLLRRWARRLKEVGPILHSRMLRPGRPSDTASVTHLLHGQSALKSVNGCIRSFIPQMFVGTRTRPSQQIIPDGTSSPGGLGPP